MISWENRREEMLICLKEQGYYVEIMGGIYLDLIDILMVYKILEIEGYNKQI